jgi:hypothetical protein
VPPFVLIFRLDLEEIARCLEAAAPRGIAVRALIAHTNRGGEKSLGHHGLPDSGFNSARSSRALAQLLVYVDCTFAR